MDPSQEEGIRRRQNNERENYIRRLQEWNAFVRGMQEQIVQGRQILQQGPWVSQEVPHAHQRNRGQMLNMPPTNESDNNPPQMSGFFYSENPSSELRTNLEPNEGLEFTLAPLYKRVWAELIDFSIVYIIKYFIIVLVFEMIGGIELTMSHFVTNYALFDPFAPLNLWKLFITVLHRLVGLIYEVMWTGWSGHQEGSMSCGTPGKICLNISIVTCSKVQFSDQENSKVLVYPASDMGPSLALQRAFLKNMLTPIEFPFLSCFYLFMYRRTVYDVISNTIVVNYEHTPQRRNMD